MKLDIIDNPTNIEETYHANSIMGKFIDNVAMAVTAIKKEQASLRNVEPYPRN